MAIRELYGGAIKALIPERFVDVSEFRQVPDHQEVFSDPVTDESIIIEILEREQLPDNEAIVSHFNDLAEANSAEARILKSESIPHVDLPQLGTNVPFTAGFLIGEQNIAKFREDAKNLVGILILLVRLPSVTTDLLISYNGPQRIAEASSSWGAQPSGEDPVAILGAFARHLEIVNWNLFG